jgi:hypothetical protein
MSEAAEPGQQRRGPVGFEHPLTVPIDPETGDPVKPRQGDGGAAGKRERAPGTDRWGLQPLPKTWYRGRVGNIVRSAVPTSIGELVTYHFDLTGDETRPPLPIEFVGYTFSRDIRSNLVVETYIGDTFPTERLRRERMRLSFEPSTELRAYRPVERRFAGMRKDLKLGILAVIMPVVVVCLITWVIGKVLHFF